MRAARPRCPDQNYAASVQMAGGNEARLAMVPARILGRHHPAREHQPRVGEIETPMQ